jgi:ankyrin repeat protein
MNRNHLLAVVLACSLAGAATTSVAAPAPVPSAATPALRSLFLAAGEGDEATFKRLVGAAGTVAKEGVDGDTLLHVLLRPAPSLRADEAAWRSVYRHDARDRDHWLAQRARHIALLPAKTRMLALALQHGAAVNEGTSVDNTAALHLAAAFGTPDMVAMLLKSGANVLQRGGSDSDHAPLAYALDPGGEPAELITPAMRTANVLALLAAGAPAGKTDHVSWNDLLQMTAGTAVLDKVEAVNPLPVADEGKSPYAYAARAGNVAAIGWLKTRVPRIDKAGKDRWLDAAIWALYQPAPVADALLAQLLVKEMPFAQKGPLGYEQMSSHVPMESGQTHGEQEGAVLLHAVQAGRADWATRLVALGAPLGRDGVDELASAVAQGNVEMVKLLLKLGADPRAGAALPLQRALYAYPSATSYGDGDPLPQHVAVILPLLLTHIVNVNKTPLDDIPGNPLGIAVRNAGNRYAKGQARADGAARVRLLLNAGFSARALDKTDAVKALAAPDRTLAAELLDHGMLRGGPVKSGYPRSAEVLVAAVVWHRADILPRLLKLGFDPNFRSEDGRNPVDVAIEQGAVPELAALIAGGGRIDTAFRDASGGLLDRAVASRSAAMLGQMTGNLAQRLERVCLPDTDVLVDLVLTAPDAYWALLRKQGFATDDQACPGLAARVVTALAEERPRILAGWIGTNLYARLPQLGSMGPERAALPAAIWPQLRSRYREDLRQLLLASGWQPPLPAQGAAARTADAALRKSLPGKYAFSDMGKLNEAVSSILLRENGTFVYRLQFGEDREASEGRWEVRDGKVAFTSPLADVRKFLLAPSQGKAPDGTVVLTVQGDPRLMARIDMVLLGDAPVEVVGRWEGDSWSAPLAGPLRHIVLTDRDNPRGQPVVFAVPAAQAPQRMFRLDLNPAPGSPMALNLEMAVEKGALVWRRTEMTMTYEKTPGQPR